MTSEDDFGGFATETLPDDGDCPTATGEQFNCKSKVGKTYSLQEGSARRLYNFLNAKTKSVAVNLDSSTSSLLSTSKGLWKEFSFGKISPNTSFEDEANNNNNNEKENTGKSVGGRKSPAPSAVTGMFSDGFPGFKKKQKHPESEAKMKRPRQLSRAESIRINEQCAEMFLKMNATHILPNNKIELGTLLVTPTAVMFETSQNQTGLQTTEASGKQKHHQEQVQELIIPMTLIASASMFSDLSSISTEQKQQTSSDEANKNHTQKVGTNTSPKHDDNGNGHHGSKHSKSKHEDGDEKREKEHNKVSQTHSYRSPTALARFFGANEEESEGGGERERQREKKEVECEIPLFLRICINEQLLSSDQSISKKKKAAFVGPIHPTYWFKIPPDWVDRVYAFFVQWTPEEGVVLADDKEDKGKHKDACATADDASIPDCQTFVLIDKNSALAVDDTNPCVNGVPIGIADSNRTAGGPWGSTEEEDGASFSFCSSGDYSLNNKRRYTKEWEILHKDEYVRRQLKLIEETLPMPDIYGQSMIMSSAHIRKLLPHLPSRCVGTLWVCLYNSRLDGLSINTLFRKCEPPLDQDTCCLLIIDPSVVNHDQNQQTESTSHQNTSNQQQSATHKNDHLFPTEESLCQSEDENSAAYSEHAFGAILSNPLRITKGSFIGSGQTLVFKFSPKKPAAPSSSTESKHQSAPLANSEKTAQVTDAAAQSSSNESSTKNLRLHCYQWAGTNNLFCSCGPDYITIGGDPIYAKPALSIDGELATGQSFECETFNSPKLTPDNKENFAIRSLELWAFVPENCLEVYNLQHRRKESHAFLQCQTRYNQF